MTDRERILDALKAIEDALSDNNEYPAYDSAELEDIAVTIQNLERRLKLTEKETWEPQPQQQ